MKELDLDRRCLKRHHSLVTAYLLFSGHPPVACLLRDVSPQGAKVDLGDTDPVALPRHLLLFLPGGGKLMAADVRWQGEDVVGLQFVSVDVEKVSSISPDIFALQIQVADLALSSAV